MQSSDTARPRPAAETDQDVVDAVYGRLDELRERYRARLAAVRRSGPSGSPQNRSERDAFATHYEDALSRLDQVENRLVFGRLDLTDGTSRYVGRIGIADEDQESLLIDWRAPAAQPFYRATAVDRGQVVRRRHLLTRARRVVGVEDELLDTDAAVEGLTGEGALFAAMAAKREGRMGDIVATIQQEQDRVIRSAPEGILVVEGGPGTGKTAVALHRAAYLLYTHRDRLARSGVLVVGPSQVFLRYIEQVLPSLGESGVVATTMADLLADVEVAAAEPEEVARVKGRATMAQVLRRAVRAIPRRLTEPVALDIDGERLVLEPQDVTAAQERARRSARPHNVARKTYATTVLETLVRRWAETKGLDLESEHGYLLQSLRESRDARREINLRWMPTTPERLLRRLYADPQLLAQHARGLSETDRRLLQRPADAPWTEADLPLLDELRVLLGTLESPEAERARRAREAERAAAESYAAHAIAEDGIGGGIVDAATLAARFAGAEARGSLAERAAADRAWTYGHVVVDEAQELSPMAWRALLRRNPSRSMTLVGDLDQRAGHHRVRGWDELLGPAAREQLRTERLTINYRTPAAVMTAAVRALRAAGGGHAVATSSARDLPDSLRVTTLDGDSPQDRLAEVVAGELAELDGGRLAVLAASPDVEAVRASLAGRLGGALHAPRGDVLAAPVVVLDPVASKGLEFDVVVLLEPGRLLDGGPGDLYVAATRPTRRLHVVHRDPLPAGLVAPQAPDGVR